MNRRVATYRKRVAGAVAQSVIDGQKVSDAAYACVHGNRESRRKALCAIRPPRSALVRAFRGIA